MFLQNFIKLRAAVRELSCWQREKNSDENHTVGRYGADSNDTMIHDIRMKTDRQEIELI